MNPTSSTTPGVPFRVPEDLTRLVELGRGAHAIVYRAPGADRDWALKVFSGRNVLDSDSLLALRREAALLALVNHPSVACVHEVGQISGQPYLVMDLIDGRSLSEVLGVGPLDIGKVIRIGREIAEAMHAVHTVGLIHRDVKPQNIMIEPDGRARLIDFSLASRSAAQQEGAAAGTLLYCPPEQSGLLHRPVDARSDLYALGAVLFECVAGQPPFVSSDAGELMRLHAAEPAPDLLALRSDTPVALAALVAKLLSKDPDDRYPNAAVLCADLRRIEADPQSEITVGRTGPGLPRYRTALVSSETDIKLLDQSWVRAQRGSATVTLLRGAAGTGKSRLMQEFSEGVRAGGHPVLSVDTRSAPTPLAPMRGAFDRYLAALTAADPRQADALRARLDKSDSEGRAGGVDTLADMLVDIARDENGLILCVDDADRLDEASGAVITRALRDMTGTPLLVLLSTVAPELTGYPVDVDITIEPLDQSGVAALITELVRGQRIDAGLVERLATRGGTTPLGVIEYISAVVDAGLLTPSWGSWHLDTDGLDAMALPTDLEGLLRHRVAELDPDDRALLREAAALRQRFEAPLLARLRGVDETRVEEILGRAATRGIVDYRDAAYGFLHHRIREALLEELSEDELRDLHQRIALILIEATEPDPAHRYVVAEHLLNGRPESVPRLVVEVCGTAGRLALANQAPSAAIPLLIAAIEYSDSAAVADRVQLQSQLGLAYAGAAQVSMALAVLREALAVTPPGLTRARLLAQLANVHRAGWQTDEVFEVAGQALAALGRPVPTNPGVLAVTTLLRFLAAIFIERTGIGFGTVRGDRRERLELESHLYQVAGTAAVFGLRMPMSGAMLLRSLYTGTRLGLVPEYAEARSGLALVANVAGLPWAQRSADKVDRIAVAIGDPVLLNQVQWRNRSFRHMAGTADLRNLSQDVSRDRKYIDGGEYASVTGGSIWRLVFAGYVREAEDHLRANERYMIDVMAEAIGSRATVAAAAGRIAEADRLLTEMRDKSAVEPPHGLARTVNLIGFRVQVAVEQQDLGEAFDSALSDYAALGIRTYKLLNIQRLMFGYAALGRLEQARRAPAERRDAAVAAATEAVRNLAACPKDGQLRPLIAVCRAGLAQVSGDQSGALTLLDKADKMLLNARMPVAVFEAARVRARAYAALGDEALSRCAAAAALSLADEYGWPHRAGWIRAEFGLLSTVSATRMSMSRPGNSGTANIAVNATRLAAVERMSLAAARIIDPTELTRVCLDQIITLLSAERACLFLCDADGTLTPHLGRDAAGVDLLEMTAYGSTLVERVRESREPLVVTGTDEGAALGSQSAVMHGLRSIMAAPLLLDNRLLGVVYLDSRVAKGMFTSADSGVLTAITTHVAAALETARAAQLAIAVDSARKERDIAITLRDAVREVSTTLDPADVLARLHRTMHAVLAADRSRLIVIDEGKIRITDGETEVASMHADADPSLAAMLRGDQPTIGDPQTVLPPALADVAGDCWLAVPLRDRHGSVGMIVLVATTAEGFGPTQCDIGAALAEQGMIAYENARLFTTVQRLAITDGLTGLTNRRHFFELAQRELSIARRNESPLAAVMLDIDHFKRINDTHGHTVGDQVIIAIARRLSATARTTDIVGRYGGEEFAMILPHTGGEGPPAFAERVRSAIADCPVDTDVGPLTVTASLGVAHLQPDDAAPSDMLTRADAALYRAKQGGRNQVATDHPAPVP